MRIALVTEVFLPAVDGVVTRLRRTLEELPRAGDDVLMIAPAGGPESYAGVPVLGVRGLRVPLYPDGEGYPPKRVALPGPALSGALRAYRPDVVHAIQPVLLGVGAVAFARRNRVPLVASYHAHLTSYARLYRLGWLESAGRRYLRGLHNCAQVNLATSQATLAELRSQRIERLALWPYGVDLQRFHPGQATRQWRERLSGGDPERLVLLYVGRLAKEKTVERLVEAVRARPDVALAIVGDGPLRARARAALPRHEHDIPGIPGRGGAGAGLCRGRRVRAPVRDRDAGNGDAGGTCRGSPGHRRRQPGRPRARPPRDRRPALRPGRAVVIRALLIGMAGSAVAPGRLGEAARAWLIARRAGRVRDALATVIGTLLSQTLLNVLALVILSVVAVAGSAIPGARTESIVLTALVPAACVVAIVGAPAMLARARAARTGRRGRILAWIRAQLVDVRQGLAVFHRRGPAVHSGGFQLLAWGMQWGACYAVLLAFGLQARAGIAAAAAVLVAVNITAIVPVTPSSVGVFQAACIAVLAPFGIHAGEGLAYGLVLQAVEIGCALAMGVPSLLVEGVSIGELRAHADGRRAEACEPRRLPQRAGAGGGSYWCVRPGGGSEQPLGRVLESDGQDRPCLPIRGDLR